MSNDEKRVLIKYSVDLSEVPDRVSLMVIEVANQCGELAKLCRSAATQAKEEPVESLHSMTEVMKNLQRKQIRIEETMELLIGYVRETTPPPEEKISKKKTKKTKKKKED